MSPAPTLLARLVAGFLLVLLAGPGTPLPAVGTEGDPPAPQAACDTEAHRAFDFWVGGWEVRRPDGDVAGHNTIEKKMGGCVLHERYSTEGGYAGESFNIYDAGRGVWHQTWVDNGGLLLRLEGGPEEGAMVLRGETVRPDGSRVLERITWSVVDGDPDRVRQHWEQSTDGGETWTTAFDGLYVRTG